MEELEKQITELKGDLKSLIEKEVKAMEEGVKSSMDPTVKEQAKNMAEMLKSINEQNERIDKLAAKANNNPTGFTGVKSFQDVLEENLEKNVSFLSDYKVNKKGFGFDIDKKAVGIMGSGTNLVGNYLVPAQVQPGILNRIYEQAHARDVMNVGSTRSNVIRYIQDNGGEGGFTTVAEGALKPMIDRDLEIKDAPVRKIAAYFRVPEEMIEDIPYLGSFLTQVGLEELKLVEDQQILYGDGTGQNLTGVNVNAQAYAAGTLIVPNANNWDVLISAMLQLRLGRFQATAIWVNPADYVSMRLAKNTNGDYLFPELAAGLSTIDGVALIQSTIVTAGSFLLGDFRRGAQLFDRMAARVQFYDQDQDNAIRNLVTIVIEERLALPIYRPTAFVKGTFAAAKTDLAA